MKLIIIIAILLMAGFVGGRVASKFKLPSVTGYIIIGVIIGPSVLNIVSAEFSQHLTIINEIALALIAFSIGSEFNIKHLETLGKKVFIITLLQSLGAVILVDFLLLVVLKVPVHLGLTLGAIAAATAPAATIMVVREYKAKGPMTDTLLPVVALDDAVCIMIFGLSTAISKMLIGNTGDINFLMVMVEPIIEILGSLVIGFLIGLLISWMSKKIIKGPDEMLVTVFALILSASGIADMLNISPLLTCMMVGATVANVLKSNKKVYSAVDKITPIIYVAFFTLAGTDLNLGLITNVGLIGIVYILSRSAGKIIGTAIGGRVSGASPAVYKYLGMCLLPQAGVAIGLTVIAENMFPDIASELSTIVLSAVMIYELIGPVLTKMALIKAGEIETSKKPQRA